MATQKKIWTKQKQRKSLDEHQFYIGYYGSCIRREKLNFSHVKWMSSQESFKGFTFR